MSCATIQYARHAFERMFERALSPKAVEQVVATGEIIQTYPEDHPYPSRLLLGFDGITPIHVVVAQDPATADCIVVTAYIPSQLLWNPDFKTRRNR
jgi:hypothetical protein